MTLETMIMKVNYASLLHPCGSKSPVNKHILFSSGVSQRHKISVSFVKRLAFFSTGIVKHRCYIEGTRVGWATIRI